MKKFTVCAKHERVRINKKKDLWDDICCKEAFWADVMQRGKALIVQKDCDVCLTRKKRVR